MVALARFGCMALGCCLLAAGGCVRPPEPPSPPSPETAGIFDAEGKPVVKVDIRKPGEGPSAQAGSTVTIHYTGTFVNGDEFDSTLWTQAPYEIKLGLTPPQTIVGLEEGLLGIRAGESRRVVIPYPLAYGEAGWRAKRIPPKANLIFEVQCVSVR